jgi:hypothetical protein
MTEMAVNRAMRCVNCFPNKGVVKLSACLLNGTVLVKGLDRYRTRAECIAAMEVPGPVGETANTSIVLLENCLMSYRSTEEHQSCRRIQSQSSWGSLLGTLLLKNQI